MSDATKVLELMERQKGDFEHLKKSVSDLESANNAGEVSAIKERQDKIDNALDAQAEAMEKVVKSIEAEKAKTKAVAELQQGDNHEECITFLKELKSLGRGDSSRFDTNDMKSSKKALAEHKASVHFNERDDAAGGITVLPVIDSLIGKLMREFSQVRGIASVATITGDQWKQIIRKQTNGALRKSKLNNFNDGTKSDRFGEISIMVDDLFSIVPFTDNLEMDTAFNIVGDILSSAAEEFTITESSEFINNGTGEGLKGILTYADDDSADGNSFDKIQAIASAGSSLAFDDVWNLFYSLKSAYTPGAVAFANRLTMRELRKLKDTQNRYLWEFNNQVGQPATIGGYPVIEMPELVAPAANGTFTTGDQPIIFGDFKGGYKVVDGMGITTTRDNLTDYPNIVYKMKKRSGGGLTKGECIKKLKMV